MRSTPTGARPTTSRSGRSTCSTTRCCASRCALEHIKPRLLGHWGTTPGLNFVYAHLNRADPRARPRRDLRHRARATAARASSPTPTSRAPTREVYPRHRPRRGGAAPAVPPVLVPRRHPEPRRAGDARLDPRGRRARLLARRTPTARRSTTPTCSSAASSATARPRPARSPRAGTRTSSSTRRATAPCCRSCT